MFRKSILLLPLLAMSGCASNKNALRDMDNVADLQAAAAVPVFAPEDLEGVWLDSGGTALLWAKIVDGEYRFFVQDSLPYGVTDTETLINANDGGKKARELAKDWPTPKGTNEGEHAALSNVITAKATPGLNGAPPMILQGTWAYAQLCHGEPERVIGHEMSAGFQQTPKGTKIFFLRLWNTPGANLGAGEHKDFQRTYLFARIDNSPKGSVGQELDDTNNFCRAQ